MTIFAVDDEMAMLYELHQSIREACPEAEIHVFRFADEALKAITEDGIHPDIVFSDIELPGMNGLDLALKIKQLSPLSKIIFVTGYSQYALEAYRQHINGYVLKPIDAEQIRRELDYLMEPYRQEPDKIQVRCFGQFEVFWHGKPVSFGRQKTKELFAFLIDRNSICSSAEIADALWEGETDMKACKTRLRSLLHDLKGTLSEIGVNNIVIRRRDTIGIDPTFLDCDYYCFLKGDIQAINAFRGEYMKQYSWAESTLGNILFRR